MAYCDINHVQAHNAGRGVYTSSTKPTASQVGQFINEAASEIDMALVDGGYALPVPASASSAQVYLQKINAMGALCSVEASAQISHNEDSFCSTFKSALKQIAKGAKLPGLEKSGDTSLPRESLSVASPPFFTRDMQL